MRITLTFFIFFIAVFFSGVNISYSQMDSLRISADSSLTRDNDPNDLPNGKGFIIRGDSGKSYLVIKISVRLNGAYDINGLQSQESFDTYEIPVGSLNTYDPRFFIGPYQSRFGFEAEKQTGLGAVFMKLEGDFLGKNNNFRIRQSYVALKSFLLGKTRSVFGDPDAIPNKVDRDGPNSSLSQRSVQIRFEPPRKELLQWAVSLEAPDPDVTEPDSAEISPVFQSFPDIAARINLASDIWGHIQLASIFRSITVRNINDELEVLTGYGGLLSGNLKLNKILSMKYQVFGGKGIARYVKSLTGHGLDVIYDNEENRYRPVETYGGYISFGNKWNKIFSNDITAGITRIVNFDSQPGDAFKLSYYASANIFMYLGKILNLGLEYSFGKRVNKNNQSGNANRISFISIADF